MPAVVAPSPERPTMLAVVAPSPERPTMLAVVAPSPERPTMLAVVAPSPERPTMPAVVAPSPERPMTSFLAHRDYSGPSLPPFDTGKLYSELSEQLRPVPANYNSLLEDSRGGQ